MAESSRWRVTYGQLKIRSLEVGQSRLEGERRNLEIAQSNSNALHEIIGILRPIAPQLTRHKEWRRIAKRERRRRIRKEQAKFRDQALFKDPEWFEEQKLLELFEYQQIENTNTEENEKWLKAERLAQEQWQTLQRRKENLHLEQIEREAKLKMEWELEKLKKEKEQERLREIEEENKRKQKTFMKHLEKFLVGDSLEPPPELMIFEETRPGAESCPFFSKTACCRFGDQCSRNHVYPGISKIILATNFFTHFGLENATYNEYDTDVMLEYEDSDTYKEFVEFFNDVLSEFEKFGKIIQFRVCNNFEKHLRGNTYVEFAELRCAVAAYRALHSRWYGGKQLSLRFCHITSWKNAICGYQARKRCPKGRACNFLHVFRNPKNFFAVSQNHHTTYNQDRVLRTPVRHWRWSESPEVDLNRRKRSRSRSRETKSRTKDEKRRRHKHTSSRRSSERNRKDKS